MGLIIGINDVPLFLDQHVGEDALIRAGLKRMPVWKCWLRGGTREGTPWVAADPRVVCFDGALEIYPCRDGYLDPDRQWGTASTVIVRDGAIRMLEICVIDGKYAAGNLFERFIDACSRALGQPDRLDDGEATWQPGPWRVEAVMAADAMNATFLVSREAG